MTLSWGEIAKRSSLPWATIERQRARVEAERIKRAAAVLSEDEQIERIQLGNRARQIAAGMRDGEIRAMAEKRAALLADLVNMHAVRVDWWDWIGGWVERLGGRAIDVEACGVDRVGVLLRYQCKDWWTRQIRRAVVQMREAAGRAESEVCARKRQPYLTDDTVRRLLERDAAARAMLERVEIESEAGDVLKLADAVDASTSNPAIRRGELMTRITGCEAWADARGWPGLFTTHTTPSRFHATHHTGEKNATWEAAGRPTVKAGQKWLCATWAKCRAAMARKGLDVFGFRVAEPHQDGTPHWHMLIWCKPGQREAVEATMRAYWLKDAGEERGAAQHRFKAKPMQAGGAAGYVAKYISKGIDDAGDVGAAGHVDDAPDGRRVAMEQGDMFGGGAARVRMWARAHGIRQFQAIGQPPVTVWRELRRVEAGEAAQAPGVIRDMWDACNRDGERRASWATFMERQGGACIGRHYRVQVWTEAKEQAGRYETATVDKPVGVLDRMDGLEQVVRSSRKEWKPKGAWRNDKRGFDVVAGRTVVGVSGGAGRHGFDADGCLDGRARASAFPLVAPVLRQGPKGRAAWTRANNCTGQKAKKLIFDWWEVFSPEFMNGEGPKRPERSDEREQKNDPGAHRLPHMWDAQGDARHP